VPPTGRTISSAGLSVAAVAIPVAIAYAQLAGFSPSTGLYASILPMVVYALAGTSRQLIIGPDAATCAMIAAVIAPLAANNSGLYLSFSIALTLLTGIFCVRRAFCASAAWPIFSPGRSSSVCSTASRSRS
jgi:MFS superfamily sulfate permease-like transporter